MLAQVVLYLLLVYPRWRGGLQAVSHHYAGTGLSVYKFGKRSKPTVWAEGYWIGN